MTQRKMRVHVRPEHIDMAMRNSSGKCMVAEALRGYFKAQGKVCKAPMADLQTIRYTDENGVRRTWLAPTAAQAALIRYDAGDHVQPFYFDLRDPLHISRPTVQTEGQAHRRTTEGVGGDAAYKATLKTRVGGRPIPVGKNNRREFGMRGMRINRDGDVHVEQENVEAAG